MKNIKSFLEFNPVNEQLFGNPYKEVVDFITGNTKDVEGLGKSAVSGNLVANVSGDKGKNIKILIETMKKHGITNPYSQKAILGVIGKESGFIPKAEVGYSGSKASRIRAVFPSRLSKMSDAQIDALKKDPVKFFNTIYGGKYGNSATEGYKYRGRGFNQITFKSGYEKMQNLINKEGKLGRSVNIVGNPDELNNVDVAAEAAVLFFLNRSQDPKLKQTYGVSDINGFKDQETAYRALVHANAGLGTSTGGKNYTINLAKAKESGNQFNIANLA